jgi:hypothetical protein
MIATTDELDRCGPPVVVFRVPGLSTVRFELRSADRPPPPAYRLTFLYRRQGDNLTKALVGSYADGIWKDTRGNVLDPQGLHWTAMVDDR